jgi:hypothetical protein
MRLSWKGSVTPSIALMWSVSVPGLVISSPASLHVLVLTGMVPASQSSTQMCGWMPRPRSS